MTKRRYHLPILATVIGLVVSGCGVFGGNSDDYTITVTVSGPSASERALGDRGGNSAPGFEVRRQYRCSGHITPAVERTAADGVSVTVTADPVGPVLRIPGQHAPRRCLEPDRIAGQGNGIDGAYNSLHEHRETRGGRSSVYIPLTEDNALICRLCNPFDARAVIRVSPSPASNGNT